jgi:hypothetical protein
MNLEISRQIFENTRILIFMKIRPIGAELFHADIRTDERTDGHADIMWIIVIFHNFANAPDKSIYVSRVGL